MKKSILTISALLAVLTYGVHWSANAAEPKPAAEQKATECKTEGKASKARRRMAAGFRCGPGKCVCTGKADCDDLDGTHICKGPIKDGECTRK